MKFGQLIEYKMRNIFLEKSYTKRGRETIPRLFSKKSKLSISYLSILSIFEHSPALNKVLNPLTTGVPHHIETSQLIFRANQLTGFHVMGNIGC